MTIERRTMLKEMSAADLRAELSARTLPEDAETGGGLMVAVIQLSIALGSTVGGLVFDSLGWHSTFALSGLLLLGAAGVTFLLSVKIRSSQRTAINELNA